jgi:hypothetical protein
MFQKLDLFPVILSFMCHHQNLLESKYNKNLALRTKLNEHKTIYEWFTRQTSHLSKYTWDLQ